MVHSFDLCFNFGFFFNKNTPPRQLPRAKTKIRIPDTSPGLLIVRDSTVYDLTAGELLFCTGALVGIELETADELGALLFFTITAMVAFGFAVGVFEATIVGVGLKLGVAVAWLVEDVVGVAVGLIVGDAVGLGEVEFASAYALIGAAKTTTTNNKAVAIRFMKQ